MRYRKRHSRRGRSAARRRGRAGRRMRVRGLKIGYRM